MFRLKIMTRNYSDAFSKSRENKAIISPKVVKNRYVDKKEPNYSDETIKDRWKCILMRGKVVGDEILELAITSAKKYPNQTGPLFM